MRAPSLLITFCKGLPGRVAAQISRCARLRASSRCARLRRRACAGRRGDGGGEEEDPTSFGLGSLSGSTTTTTSALSRTWGRSRRPSAAERAPAARVPCPDEFDGGRARAARGRGVAVGERSIPSPFAKGPWFEGISRTVPCVAGALAAWSSFEAIYTPHLTLEVANRCERAACSTRGALVSTWSPMRAAGG